VLSVTAVGADLAEARARVYEGVAAIRLVGGHHRSDIAWAASRGEVSVPELI
jgi:phosphoribosylamine---glycine ligase